MSISKTSRHLHFPFEKSIVEWTMQYMKDKIENFDYYFTRKKNMCKLKHTKQWLQICIYRYNKQYLKLTVM